MSFRSGAAVALGSVTASSSLTRRPNWPRMP